MESSSTTRGRWQPNRSWQTRRPLSPYSSKISPLARQRYANLTPGETKCKQVSPLARQSVTNITPGETRCKQVSPLARQSVTNLTPGETSCNKSHPWRDRAPTKTMSFSTTRWHISIQVVLRNVIKIVVKIHLFETSSFLVQLFVYVLSIGN